MQRFNNPHPPGGHMRVMNQQQQPMQHMQQQQQMPQNGNVIQMPNGMLLLPNGMVVTPQQAQALMGGGNMMPMNNGMPMQGGMQMNMMPMTGGMPMNMGGMPTNTGRFGNQNQTVTGGISGTAIPEGEFTTDSRFQSSNTQMGQSMEDQGQAEVVTPTTFSISVTKGVKFNGNSKVVLNSYYEEVKPNQIHVRENNITLAECFEEAIEGSIGHAIADAPNKLISVSNFLIENSFYKAADQEQFNKLILDNDIKAMYKAVKAAWPTLTSKYDIYMFDKFDTILTDTINDFIGVNSPVDVHIDSFMSDFNELLKFLRNLEDCDADLEDELINHMNSFITRIKSNLELNASQLAGIDAEDGKKVTYIPEEHLFAYVDKYSHELGVVDAPKKLTLVEDNAINAFLLSAAKAIMSKQEVFTFYMTTIDKTVLQFVKSLNGGIFIKQV